jgi:hypothetical protein
MGLGGIRGVFERRGRKGFAKCAEESKEKNKTKKEEIQLLIKKFECIFYISFFFFCALCETFAPSAFK